MKKINIVRKVLKLPFAIIVLPMLVVIGFFLTNWESESEIRFYKTMLKDLIW